VTKKWQGSKWIRPERRRAIYERDGYACKWCHKELERGSKALTLDHKRPRSKGGDNSNGNLVTACRGCNSSRQTSPRPKVRPENRALSYGALAPGAYSEVSRFSPDKNNSAGRPNTKSVDSVVKRPHKNRTGRKAPSARTGPLASSAGRSYVRPQGTQALTGMARILTLTNGRHLPTYGW
jgi:hypothetical protein